MCEEKGVCVRGKGCVNHAVLCVNVEMLFVMWKLYGGSACVFVLHDGCARTDQILQHNSPCSLLVFISHF